MECCDSYFIQGAVIRKPEGELSLNDDEKLRMEELALSNLENFWKICDISRLLMERCIGTISFYLSAGGRTALQGLLRRILNKWEIKIIHSGSTRGEWRQNTVTTENSESSLEFHLRRPGCRILASQIHLDDLWCPHLPNHNKKG